MDENKTVQLGALETLRRLAATILAILQNRLELLVVELEEERLRLFNALLLTAAIVARGFVTLALAAFALAVVAWHEYGVLGLAGFSFSASGHRSVRLLFVRLRS
jgi:uncharacterized membrane protein YqjE